MVKKNTTRSVIPGDRSQNPDEQCHYYILLLVIVTSGDNVTLNTLNDIVSKLNEIKENFQAELLNINWGWFYGTSNVNQAWDFFSTKKSVCDTNAPRKIFHIRRVRQPQLNDDITELCANRDYLFHVGRCTNQPALFAETLLSIYYPK